MNIRDYDPATIGTVYSAFLSMYLGTQSANEPEDELVKFHEEFLSDTLVEMREYLVESGLEHKVLEYEGMIKDMLLKTIQDPDMIERFSKSVMDIMQPFRKDS